MLAQFCHHALPHSCFSIPAFSSLLKVKNDFELAIRASKELEHFLTAEFGAEGKGLHEKIDSAAQQVISALDFFLYVT